MRDVYCPQVVFTTDPACIMLLKETSINICLGPIFSGADSIGNEVEETTKLQNRLLAYRIRYGAEVAGAIINSESSDPQLSANIRALAAPIMSDDLLRTEVIECVKQYHGKSKEICSISPDVILLQALLDLTHADLGRVFVREIAQYVDRLYRERRENRQATPESIGYSLKKLGIQTQSLGSQGRGIYFDHGVIAAIHDLAWSRGLIGKDFGEECGFCAKYGGGADRPV